MAEIEVRYTPDENVPPGILRVRTNFLVSDAIAKDVAEVLVWKYEGEFRLFVEKVDGREGSRFVFFFRLPPIEAYPKESYVDAVDRWASKQVGEVFRYAAKLIDEPNFLRLALFFVDVSRI